MDQLLNELKNAKNNGRGVVLLDKLVGDTTEYSKGNRHPGGDKAFKNKHGRDMGKFFND